MELVSKNVDFSHFLFQVHLFVFRVVHAEKFSLCSFIRCLEEMIIFVYS